MTKLDQPVGDVGGVEAEVFGVEALAAAPVADGGGAEDAAAADGFEKRQVVLLLGHVVGWLVCCFGWGRENETPARS